MLLEAQQGLNLGRNAPTRQLELGQVKVDPPTLRQLSNFAA